MTDIPGTILTAIRDAIDAAALAECAAAYTLCAELAEANAIECDSKSRNTPILEVKLAWADRATSARHIASKIRALAVNPLTMKQCNVLTGEFGDGWLAADFPQRDAVRARMAQMVKESLGWTADPPTETSCISVIAKLRAESEAEPFRCPTCGQGQNYAAPVMLMYPQPTPGQKLLVQWEGEEPYEISAEPSPYTIKTESGQHFDFATGLFSSNKRG